MGVHLQLLEALEALGREDPLGVPDGEPQGSDPVRTPGVSYVLDPDRGLTEWGKGDIGCSA